MEENIFVLSERFENHFIFLKRKQFLLTPVLISLQNQEQLIKRVEKKFLGRKKSWTCCSVQLVSTKEMKKPTQT